MFTARPRPSSEYGSADLAVRPTLRYELNPNGSLTVHPPGHCPRRHPVGGAGTFSWVEALHLHSLACGRCRAEGHDEHEWAVIDPAYEQVSLAEARGVGVELVAVPPDDLAGVGGPGRIELRLDACAVGVATLVVCAQDGTGVLEHVQVDGEYRGRGYGRILALAAFSRVDWATDGPRWVRGDRRVRALREARRGAGYTWSTALIEPTAQARGFAGWLPLATVGEPRYCRHMLDAAARLTS